MRVSPSSSLAEPARNAHPTPIAYIATAGRDIHMETTIRSATNIAGVNTFSRTHIDRVASLVVAKPGGTLIASAGRDMNLVAASILNTGTDGRTTLTAARNLNLTTVTTAEASNITWDAKNRISQASSTEVGTTVQGSGAVRLAAGNDLNARAATVQADGALVATAANNIHLLAGTNTLSLIEAHEHTGKTGGGNKKTIATQDTLTSSTAVGSSLGGNTVDLTAGNDIALTGAQVLADQDIHATAGRNLTIAAATSTSSTESHRIETKTGWFSGGLSVGYGTTTTATDQRQLGSIQSGTQERSMLGSVNGSVTLTAGTAGTAGGTGTTDGALKISGSDVQAGKDITATGSSVHIDPGLDHSDATTRTKTVTDAVSLAIGGSVVSAAQTLQSLNASANKTKNKRMQALALAAQAMAAAQAAAAVAADGGSVSLSLTANHSESTTQQTDTSTSNAGSQLTAGRNVQITATGAGTGTGTGTTNPNSGNINIIGSGITAGHNVQLSASQDIRIASAQDTEAHRTEHSDWTVGAGIGVSASSNGGAALGVTANAGIGVATQKSQASTQLNSHISAGNNLNVTSGRDTTIQGGVLSADSVNADVGRNLTIASLQDTASASAKSASASVAVTAGYGVSVSASLAYAQSKNDFASVDEQSGIRAGDGGFTVNVKGNTDLKGAVITSSQQAVDASKNSLSTATLTQSDIANHSTASGIGLSASASSSTGGTDKDASKSGTGAKEVGGMKLADQGNAGNKMGPTSLGAASESDSSTTRSGISGATLTIGGKTTRTDKGETTTDSNGKAINTAVTTGTDTAAKLAKPSSLEDIQAQVQIVQSFGSQAAKAVGDYAGSKSTDLKAQAQAETDPDKKQALLDEAKKWDEGGTYRIAAHAAIGGLTGGVDGALGAAASAAATPTLNNLQNGLQAALQQAGLGDASKVIAQVAGTAAATTLGAVASGGSVAGAVAAGNADANNRQLHPAETQRIKELAKGDAEKEARLTEAACALAHCADGVPTDDPNYAYLKGLQDAGANLTAEKSLLARQQGQQGRIYGQLFQYTGVDQYIIDPATQNKLGTRAGGALQAVGGAALIASGGGECATGVGCVLGAASIVVGADNLKAGATTAATGNAAITQGEQVLQSLGLSPQAAAVTYALVGLSPAAVEGLAANKAANQAAVYNPLARASYSDFTTQGVTVTKEIMATPQVQAMLKEAQAASPTTTANDIKDRVTGWLESGTSIPSSATAAPGSVLIKVVPKGDVVTSYTPFWMSAEQARAIGSMTAEQAGQALGLPAAQAAKMLSNGLDYYAITPVAGAAPKVFVSNVASTTQGAVVNTAPSAQQVIVPNRSLWTTPTPVNPFTLR